MNAEVALKMHREEFYVKKEAVPCIVMTTTHLIEGLIHKRVVFRFMDELLKDDPFLAVTNATVHKSGNGRSYETNFLVLRKDQIVWMIPSEATAEDG